MSLSFFEQPILNSPYAAPTRHHALGPSGQPLEAPPVEGRRKSELISPVPPAKKQAKKAQQGDFFAEADAEQQAYTLTIINEIRGHVTAWRALPNPSDWGVTPVTQRLMQHWRDFPFETVRPFFCQVEAVETAIWLSEVAPKQRQHARYRTIIEQANKAANPELLRSALKLATGAGKTTVMAMLIAWQTLNAVRSPNSGQFSRAFLIVAPGITIRDRLQILLPSHPDNYYAKRELVPADMLGDIAKAKIVLTNYHAFKRREVMEVSKVGRALLQGRDPDPVLTTETEGAMLKRACGELLAFRNVVVINDEAHHCYRERVDRDAETPVTAEEKEEAKRNAEAARLWISGLEALKRKVGVRTVFDLSATPFFLRGSGYRDEGADPPMHLFGDLQRIARRWISEGYLTAKGVPLAAIRYPELEARAADLIFFACQRGVQGDKTIKAILDSYNPKGSTRVVAFNTSKATWATAPDRSHVSHVVCDSEWEAELARVLEKHPRVVAYVKNQGMQFDVPYRDGGVPKTYVPDFIVKIDDGGGEPLKLVLEVKGFRGVDAQLKAETMKTLWVPGVNALGAYGRWTFEEFRDIYGAQEQFAKLMDAMMTKEPA